MRTPLAFVAAIVMAPTAGGLELLSVQVHPWAEELPPQLTARGPDGTIYVAWTERQRSRAASSPKGHSPDKEISIPRPALRDLYVGRVSPAGEIEQIRRLGGESDDTVSAIVADEQGSLYLTGATLSNDFPVEGAGRYLEAYVIKLDGQTLETLAARRFSGNGSQEPADMKLGPGGEVFVTGWTTSSDFAVTTGDVPPSGPLGVLATDDGGETWRISNDGLIDRSVLQLAFSPAQPTTVFARGRATLARSDDSGHSWTTVGDLPPGAITLVTDPFDGSRLYLGSGQGFFVSTDAGQTWAESNVGFREEDDSRIVAQIAADPAAPGVLYAGVSFGLYKSTDFGATWSRKLDLPAFILALGLDPSAPNNVYVSEANPGGEFQHSSDGGETWRSIRSNLTGRPDSQVRAIAVDPRDSQTLFVGARNGVHRSTDQGGRWHRFEDPLTAGISTRRIEVDPLREGRVWAITDRLIVSDNDDAAWRDAETGYRFPGVIDFALDPLSRGRVLAALAGPPASNAFVVRLSADLETIYSRVFGGTDAEVPTAMTLDSQGRAVVTGVRSPAFVDPDRPDPAPFPYSFVAKLGVAGDLMFHHTLAAGSRALVVDVALDDEDAIHLAGETSGGSGFPGVAGPLPSFGETDGFVMKMSPDGSTLLASRLIGGARNDSLRRISVTRGGDLVVSGRTGSPNLPVTGFGAGCNRINHTNGVHFLARLDGDSLRIQASLRLEEVGRGFSVVRGLRVDGDEVVATIEGTSQVRLPGEAEPEPRGPFHELRFATGAERDEVVLACAVNAASLIATPAVPAGILTLYGAGLGPDLFAVPSAGDRLPTELEGVRVLFNGEPAPLLHAQYGQVSVVAPASIAAVQEVEVTVERAQARSRALRLPVAESAPGFFTDDFTGAGSALFNKDWSRVSRSNPAPAGRVVSGFVTGAGLFDGAADFAGFAPASGLLLRAALPVRAQVDGIDAQVEFAGQAAGQLNAVLQVNIRIPLELGEPPAGRKTLVFRAGDAAAQPVRVFIGSSSPEP